MSALLPCPFCGKTPVSRFVGDDDGGYHGIDCCLAFSHEATEEEAAAAWNRRAGFTPADHAALVAAAAEAMRQAAEDVATRDGNYATSANIRAVPIPFADALARRDAWQPFVYASPPDGLCWLLVERPETWCDAGEAGRTVGGYTGKMQRVVVLAEVYGTDAGPAFESVGYGDHGSVADDDLVVSFIPLAAPSAPAIRARAGGAS